MRTIYHYRYNQTPSRSGPMDPEPRPRASAAIDPCRSGAPSAILRRAPCTPRIPHPDFLPASPGPLLSHGTPLPVLILLILLLAGPALEGQAPSDLESRERPELRIRPLQGPITIDGFLDEAAWSGIEPITDLRQAEPDPGASVSERTELLLGFDAEALYIGARMFESDPEGIIGGGLERDVPGIIVEEMDAFGVAIDTFRDRRNSFIFFVNANGGVKDGQGSDDGRLRDYGWDGIVDARTRRHAWGWSMELAIPWRTLRFDPTVEDPVWGINLSRRIRRKNEVAYWAPLDRRNRIFLVSQAGSMRGMGSLPRNRNLQFKPYALAGRTEGSGLPAGTPAGEWDGGADLKWGITPGVTLDLTWRTDFSQVEVDQAQVNLTRFPVFFPELRPFFLENSGTFTFGDLDGGPGGPRQGTSLRDFTFFHSRQIGLRGGSPVPLTGGARLTGRTAGTEIGLLHVRSEGSGESPAEDFSVARVRRRVGGRSDVGLILTQRLPSGGSGGTGNQAVGIDANLRLLGSLYLNSYLAGSAEGGVRDGAARLSVGWRDPFWNVSAAVRQMGEDFRPGIGFVRRRGIREGYATLGIHHRPGGDRIAEISPFVEGSVTTNLRGDLESREQGAAVGISMRDRSSVQLSATRRFERLAAPFRLRSEVAVPVGDYDYGEGSVSYRSSQGKRLSFNVGISGGGFYDGTRATLSGGIRWQPDDRLILDLDGSRNDLAAQGREFRADLYSARVQYALSTVLAFNAFVQWNADADEIVTNLRANFIHAPLSDLFLLFTERRPVGGGPVIERYLTIKGTRLFVF